MASYDAYEVGIVCAVYKNVLVAAFADDGNHGATESAEVSLGGDVWWHHIYVSAERTHPNAFFKAGFLE